MESRTWQDDVNLLTGLWVLRIGALERHRKSKEGYVN
jgi:hypothetical protein